MFEIPFKTGKNCPLALESLSYDRVEGFLLICYLMEAADHKCDDLLESFEMVITSRYCPLKEGWSCHPQVSESFKGRSLFKDSHRQINVDYVFATLHP